MSIGSGKTSPGGSGSIAGGVSSRISSGGGDSSGSTCGADAFTRVVATAAGAVGTNTAVGAGRGSSSSVTDDSRFVGTGVVDSTTTISRGSGGAGVVDSRNTIG